MLNWLWPLFFVIAFASGCWQWLALGNPNIWAEIVKGLFDQARIAFEISFGLIGMLALWLGLLHVAERAGLIDLLARFLSPLFAKLMPDIPHNHPAIGSITMNMAANMLGLDNAATPMGIRAMEQMQELNPHKHSLSNAQALFVVLNTASVTILPVSVFVIRAQMGASDPTAVFIPILITTAIATLAGLLTVALVQRLHIFNRVVMGYFGGIALAIGLLIAGLSSLPAAEQSQTSSLIGNFTIFAIILLFFAAAWRKKVPIYEAFITGAKQGFTTAERIIPYMVAMMAAVSVLRTSGAMTAFTDAIAWCVSQFGMNTDFVPALPTAIMKSFSGSGARAMMIETMQHYGPDSFPATLTSILQGSSETTFYVIAVYCGAVGITKVRHALACGLFADFVAIVTAIIIAYQFF